jgi:hypothetical protein
VVEGSIESRRRVGRQRARLTKRLEQIQKQNGWGDMPDAEYLAERDAIHASLAALPDNDRIRSFDAYRARVLELREAIGLASRRVGRSFAGSSSSES